jgi:hypothetical protein
MYRVLMMNMTTHTIWAVSCKYMTRVGG